MLHSIVPVETSQASPACPSDKNSLNTSDGGTKLTTEHINHCAEKNAEIVTVTSYGIYCYHCALKR
jgi:CRISPR/Cas system-associated endonuclease Cas1